MDLKLKKAHYAAAVFVVCTAVAYSVGSPILAFLVALLLFAKVLSALSDGMLDTMGIELVTVPIVIIGITYGPLWFVFGFLVMPVIEFMRWLIKPPQMTGGWLPGMPSPDSFVDGLTGAAAAIFAAAFSPVLGGMMAIALKALVASVKDNLVYGTPPTPTWLINVFLNIILSRVLMGFLGI
jgi:hypothetical protein